jgi:ketosteroid isomerase-like protein
MPAAVATILFIAPSVPAQTAGSERTLWDVQIPKSAQDLTGNKKLVFDTWQAFWRGDIEAGLANMADDVTWLIPGKMKTSGLVEGKDNLRKFRHSNLHIFRESHHTVVGIYGDGNTVVMEMSAKAVLRNGQPYENAGVTVWQIENDKIKHVREYVDTYKAMAIEAVIKGQPIFNTRQTDEGH